MSFINTIFAGLKTRSTRPSMIEVHDSELRPFSGDHMLDLIARARAFFAAAEIDKGDRIALVAPNSARWAAVDLATLAHGAILVPLYARQDRGELAQMLADCTPRLLVAADETMLAEIKEAAKTRISPPGSGPGWLDSCQAVTYEALFAPEPLGEPEKNHVASEDPVTMIYTSGTSGEPKGVVYSRQNVDFMLPVTVEALRPMVEGRVGDDKVFHYLPFCFAGSRIAMWTQLFRPNPIMLSSDLNNLVAEIQTADPHFYLNVPALLERVRSGVGDRIRQRGGLAKTLYQRGMAAHQRVAAGKARPGDRLLAAVAKRVVFARIKNQIGKSLEFLICGSAPLSEDTQRWFEMIGIPVYQIYGLTETTAIVTIDTLETVRPGLVGVAIPGCETRLSEEGEIWCRGPNIFAGYWNRPEATAATMEDGWFKTGDQAEIGFDGNTQIIGRLKNLLVPESGHNVAPEPIEQMIREQDPAIEQAVVLGHGRPFLSAIVTGNLTRASIAQAIERVNQKLPHYRRVREFIRADQTFTPENGLVTANQKLKRAAIETRFLPALEEIYGRAKAHP